MRSKMDKRKQILLKISLAASGMTINDLAEHLGVSRVAIWRLINGQMKSAELHKRVNRFIKSKMNDLKIVLAEEQYE